MKRYIAEGPGLPAWSAPISHAVVVDRTCYLSGQLSVGSDGNYLPGPADEEARRAFENLFAATRAAGFEPADLVFVEIAFADLAELPAVNAVWSELFAAGRRPARTVSQAAALPYGARVKIVGVAVRERAPARRRNRA
jgi:2-iminobutanoate/2-iminopropanoate deaminase